MDELERLRNLIGPEANEWTATQLEQLKRDIDAMAALLLDMYRIHRRDRSIESCGLPRFDVPTPDR